MLLALRDLLLDPEGPIVRVDLGVPPSELGWLQPFAFIFTLLSLIVFGIHRRRVRTLGYAAGGLRSFALGAALGNAALGLGSILTPDRPCVESIQDLEDKTVADELGDGRDPPPQNRLSPFELGRLKATPMIPNSTVEPPATKPDPAAI